MQQTIDSRHTQCYSMQREVAVLQVQSDYSTKRLRRSVREPGFHSSMSCTALGPPVVSGCPHATEVLPPIVTGASAAPWRVACMSARGGVRSGGRSDVHSGVAVGHHLCLAVHLHLQVKG